MVMGSHADLLRCVDAWVEATGISKKKAIFYCQLGKYPVEGEPVIEEMKAKGQTVNPLPFAVIPSLSKGYSPEHLIMLLIAIKLLRTPQGLEVIKALGKEFIKGIFDTMHSMGQAAAGNKVAAWANPYLTSLVFERFGFVDSARMAEFRIGLSVISGAGGAEGFLDTLQGFFPFSNPEPSEFPSQLVFSAREAGVEAPSTITWEDLRKLSEKKLLPRAKKKKEG